MSMAKQLPPPAAEVDITTVASEALARIETLVPAWFPAGRRNGNEWVLGGLDGEPGRSLSINMRSGAWADFATGDKGGDLVSLIRARDNHKNQLEAAKALADEMGVEGGEVSEPTRESSKGKPKVSEYRPTMPVPKELHAKASQLAHREHGKASTIWVYRDAEGRVLHYVGRYEKQDGKQIVPWTYDPNDKGGRWRPKHAPAPRPLYQLDRIAKNPTLPVYVVEGEKAADAAQRILRNRAVVTSWSGGSNAVGKADWSPLEGREVTVWPDADKPGLKAATNVVSELRKVGAAACYVVQIEDLAENGGWDLADAETEGWTAEHVLDRAAERAETKWPRETGPDRDTSPETAGAGSAAEGPSYPYRLFGNGCIEQLGDDERYKFLCSPIRVTAYSRDGTSRDWGRLVEIMDPDGRWHRQALPAHLFAGDGSALCAILLGLGLRIAPGRKAKSSMVDLLMHWQTERSAVTTDRLGWSDGNCRTFMLGDGRVIGEAELAFQSDQVASAALEMTAPGTVTEWRDTVGALCIGNPLPIVAASLAFSGPLLELLGREGGGLHLRGASSRGKTSALAVAVSVWGSPRFRQSWRATANGLEGIAAACNSTLLALDEMGEIDGGEAAKAAYMLANGLGKIRARKYGTARRPLQWTVPILSTGEVGLAAKVAESGRRAAAGQELRLLDILADNRRYGLFDELHGFDDPAVFAMEIGRLTAESYGTAGPAFVERLLAEDALRDSDILRQVEDLTGKLMTNLGTGGLDGQCKRAAARFALIGTAGQLATAFGLTGWPMDAVEDAVTEILLDWARRSGAGDGPAEKLEAFGRTRAFIVELGASRFEWLHEGAPVEDKIVRRAGWREAEIFYIATDVWRNEVHAGSDPTRAARYLAEDGLLVPGEKGRWTTRLGSVVRGRPRAYAVKAEILGTDDG